MAIIQPRFSIQEVSETCKAAMRDLLPDLPLGVGGRLKLQRVAQRHGSELRMFLYHIWDKHQPSLLDYHHFSYGFVYDPTLRYHPTPLLVRFYANRHRIYDKKESVIPALWDEMQRAEKVLYGFRAAESEQMIALLRFFRAENLDDLKTEICQGFLELMPFWHPRYAAVIDHYGLSLTSNDVEAAISGRKKFQPRGPRSLLPIRTPYSRHVPPRLRAEVFKRDGGRCLKCGSPTALHADHILPVALGGLTVLDNLQTLCCAENLRKGNRESKDYRKKSA